MSWTDLEQGIDRELKALPQPEAPDTLVPSVMRAVALAATRTTPWYSRAWLAWPKPAQAASLAFVFLAAIAAWREGPVLWAWAMGAASAATPMPAVESGVIFRAQDPEDGAMLAVRSRYNDVLFFMLQNGRPGQVLAIARLPWQFLEPIVFYFAVLALAASLTLSASWFAFTRLNAGGVSLR